MLQHSHSPDTSETEPIEVLETYRLPLPPEALPTQPTTVIKIFDHPVKFLTYEGSVNEGKGTVRIADKGTYTILSQSEDRKELHLNGQILKGPFTLTHIKADKWHFAPCSQT